MAISYFWTVKDRLTFEHGPHTAAFTLPLSPVIHRSFTAALFQHIVTCHGSTLLPQFLAMYRVTVESEDTYLLVMRNMFSHRLHVHRKYDLKVKPAGVTQTVEGGWWVRC